MRNFIYFGCKYILYKHYNMNILISISDQINIVICCGSEVFVVTLVIIKTVTAQLGDLFNYSLPGSYHHHDQGILTDGVT